jgi:hypothetical protein
VRVHRFLELRQQRKCLTYGGKIIDFVHEEIRRGGVRKTPVTCHRICRYGETQVLAYPVSTVTMRGNRSTPDKRFPSIEDDAERTGKTLLLSTEALRIRRFGHSEAAIV